MADCRFPIQIMVKGRQIYVPCGHCAWCLSGEREKMVFRLEQEAKDHLYSTFVTLTYDDDHLPFHVDGDGVIHYDVCKRDLQKYHHNLRKHHKFRFLVSSEYGPKTHRPHYHGVYFHDEPIDFVGKWLLGNNSFQKPCNKGGFKYVLKYTLKGSNVPDGSMPNFRLMSRRPGLGASFNYKGQDYLLTENGLKLGVP